VIHRVRDLCREHGVLEPVFETAEPGVVATFKWPNARAAHQVGTKLAPSRYQVSLLRYRLHEKTIAELIQVAGRRDCTKLRDQVLKPLMEAGWLEMTIPDSHCLSKQKHWRRDGNCRPRQ